METDSALVPAAPGTLAHTTDAPLPIFSGAQMAQAMIAYRELQTALDRSMPDQIMQLDGKPFRKKGYWRAVAVAFGVSVEPVSERRETNGDFQDGHQNFGYVVTYSATAPNGRRVSSDGSCFAVEKAKRFKCIHPERPGSTRTVHFPPEKCPDFDPLFAWRVLPLQATEHNVRAHAHTRAFNRAVSNLVAFGEVSAEEVVGNDREHAQATPARPPFAPAAPIGSDLTIRTVTDREVANGRIQWTVTFSDGTVATTINKGLGESAREFAVQGAIVERTVEVKGKYTNLTGLKLVFNEPAPVETPDEAEIPF